MDVGSFWRDWRIPFRFGLQQQSQATLADRIRRRETRYLSFALETQSGAIALETLACIVLASCQLWCQVNAYSIRIVVPHLAFGDDCRQMNIGSLDDFVPASHFMELNYDTSIKNQQFQLRQCFPPARTRLLSLPVVSWPDDRTIQSLLLNSSTGPETQKVRSVTALSGTEVVNSLLYTHMEQLAGWGDAVVERVAAELRAELPDIGGFSNQNVWRMRQFYRFYSASEFLSQAVRELRRLPKSDLAAFLEQTVRKSVATKAGNIAQTEILSQAVRELITSVPRGHHVNVLSKVEDHSARLYYLRATTQFGRPINSLL